MAKYPQALPKDLGAGTPFRHKGQDAGRTPDRRPLFNLGLPVHRTMNNGLALQVRSEDVFGLGKSRQVGGDGKS